MEMAVEFASRLGPLAAAEYIAAFEPNVLWTKEFLEYRALCYEEAAHPKLELARADLVRFLRYDTKRFNDVIKSNVPVDAPQLAREN